jgi:hypothetical protein
MIQTGRYQHYSGKEYHVLGVCRHSETLDILVVYQALYADYALWVRPLDMFLETVTQNGATLPRFKYIAPMWTEPAHLR